jgi:chromosome segregation ATPase
MISIYSIKEIIEASENILSSSAKKKILPSNHDSINNIKMNIENPLILEKKQEIQKQIPKEIEDIISVAEKSKFKIDYKEASNKKQIIKPMIKEKIKLNDIVDQLYNLFNKKIKKNTLKLIVGLKNEITSLDEKIITLKKEEKKIKITNKLLKEDILNLAHHESDLKQSVEKKDLEIISINEKLIENKNKIIDLENNYTNLESDNIDLKTKISIHQNQNNELEINNNELSSELNTHKDKIIDLENDNKKLKEQVQVLSQKNLDLETILDKINIADDKNQINLDIVKTLEEKINFYQEENIRISNDLIESRKKYDITKNQIEGFENQRSTLLDKINSVNEVINNSSNVTNVFDGNHKEKSINLIKSSNKKSKSDEYLNKEILNIFSK